MEKDMPGRAEWLEVIRAGKYLSLAMCDGGRPYMIALNYSFDAGENCFYAHCAAGGRKLDILRANPAVWGMIVEDGGYIVGECSYRYRSVMFEGVAEFVEDLAIKRTALMAMIDHAEPDPEPLKARMLTSGSIAGIVVLRLRVAAMSGKQSPAPPGRSQGV
jgi:uncharacterized protein